MFRVNKKGLSNLIGNMIIVLLILASILLISMSLFKIINNPAFSPEESCPILQFNKVVRIYNACINQETNEIEITLERTSEDNFDIKTLDLIINNDKTLKYKCGNQCGECRILKTGSIKKYYISHQAKNVLEEERAKELSLIVNGCILETKLLNKC
ncbi:MAG: hypothetical protein QXH60_03155 [Candidatus Pacearchaeota archaeon]